MTRFCVTIRFLDPRFHGRGDRGPEWPPSPFRLFQALLAAASRNGLLDEEAFHWLERLSPPEILAPPVLPVSSWKNYVPNNDSDKTLDRQNRLAEKEVRPVRILREEPLHYLWRIEPEDQTIAERMALKARCLSALGWGVDLVVADGGVLSESEYESLVEGYSGDRWNQVEGASKSLRSPCPGSLEDLSGVYNSFLNRFQGNVYRPTRKPRVFEKIDYLKRGESAIRRGVAAFKLLKPDDDSEALAVFDQRKAMEIAAWIRGYLCDRSKSAGFPGDSEVYVAGHVSQEERNGKTPPRFSYLPLPSLGHERADGGVRRFLLAGPYGGDEEPLRWARQELSYAVVKDKDGVPMARLQPIEHDGVLRHYLGEATTFRTVTPVILPGYDDRNYSKAQRLVEKALEQAGFSVEDLAEPLYLQKAPFYNGCYAPWSYSLPRYLKGYSAMHVRLKWKEKVSGPLAIGAGRHFGLGLFSSCGDE